jgi:hypothetical protein
MESEGLSPSSQMQVTAQYPKLDESRPYILDLF